MLQRRKTHRFNRAAAMVALVACALPSQTQSARAVPREIVLLRHGEKQDAFALCRIGVQRSLALASAYLGKGATPSLFAAGETPAAFFTITLHTLELASPSAASWGAPLIDYSIVPLKGVPNVNEDQELDERTREAASDVMTNPLWDGKTVVMIWEHKHIANAKLEKKAADAVTLRGLLHLDELGKDVPKTWSGTNYDYFWIVRYKNGSSKPESFKAVKQLFTAPYDSLPHNDWEQPEDLPADSRCE
jgi:hypothetical protein